MMNRRMFLNNPLLTIIPTPKDTTRKEPRTQHVSIHTSSDNVCIFKSKNEKFVAHTLYQDMNDSLVVHSLISWEDPLTQTTIRKVNKEVYILKGDSM